MSECTIFSCLDALSPFAAAKFTVIPNGEARFVYGRKYLALKTASAFDPRNLPLSANEVTIPVHLDGSYGVLSDAGPNTWGMRLTESICKATGAQLPRNPVEWLLHSWHYGAGSLAFSTSPDIPPVQPITPCSRSDLSRRLLDAVDNIDTTNDLEALRIMRPGGSLGGVRPKTVVMHDGAEHIVKFNHVDDRFDVSAAEYASMRLAHEAGINTPNFELIEIAGRHALTIERFDRGPQQRRHHYISAKSLLNLDSKVIDKSAFIAKFSYAGIAEATRGIDANAVKDSQQLFRRMVFNIMIGNVDDHLRNHGFLMTDVPGDYRLSPAFDIVPHLDATFNPQSIGVGADGAASTIKNALSQCQRFYLSREMAIEIVAEVKQVVSNWRTVFSDSGVVAKDIQLLSSCFAVADEADSASA